MFSYLERAIYGVAQLRGEGSVHNVHVFRKSREDPAKGRHFEELQRRPQHIAQQHGVEDFRRAPARQVRH